MNKEIKSILFLLHIPPPVHGSSMVGEWIKKSELINSAFDCRYINLLASKTVSDSGRISVSKVFGFILVWFKLLKELLFRRPERCYLALSATGAAFYKDVLLIFLLKLFAVKRVYHLHNKGVKNAAAYSLFNRVLYQYAFKSAKVILLSQKLYGDIEAFVKTNDVFICPNGIPGIEGLQWVDKNKKQIPNILFLSNLIESKGVFVLLEALKLLKERSIAFSCTFVGGEGNISESQFQIKVKELELDGMVEYVGKKYGADKYRALREADIFAFPTYYDYETFGIVNIEAMQFGLPIISSPEGGIEDVVEEGKTGFLVPQKDPVSLANRLEQLIMNPELRIKMGDAGRKRYEERFTLEIFENRIVEILNTGVVVTKK
jgi:glycosyltransferase involved in cell wall biosynthesis